MFIYFKLKIYMIILYYIMGLEPSFDLCYQAEELPYLLQKCGDLDKLKTVISDVDIFTLLSKTEDGRFELIKAWQLVSYLLYFYHQSLAAG